MKTFKVYKTEDMFKLIDGSYRQLPLPKGYTHYEIMNKVILTAKHKLK